MTCGCPLLQTGQRTVLAKSSFPSCSRLSAHSNIEMVAGFGFPFLLDGFSSGPSAKNSAQEKSDLYVVKTSGTKGEPLKRATWTLTGSGSSQICQPPFG